MWLFVHREKGRIPRSDVPRVNRQKQKTAASIALRRYARARMILFIAFVQSPEAAFFASPTGR